MDAIPIARPITLMIVWLLCFHRLRRMILLYVLNITKLLCKFTGYGFPLFSGNPALYSGLAPRFNSALTKIESPSWDYLSSWFISRFQRVIVLSEPFVE